MTHDLKALRELEKRLAEAKGPDRSIDACLWAEFDCRDVRYIDGKMLARSRKPPNDECMICENGRWWHGVPDLTASLDAALALVERVLPSAQWATEGPKTPCATLYSEACDDENHFAATPALALCLACVRALISQGEQ